jgi:hypothetical protein
VSKRTKVRNFRTAVVRHCFIYGLLVVAASRVAAFGSKYETPVAKPPRNQVVGSSSASTQLSSTVKSGINRPSHWQRASPSTAVVNTSATKSKKPLIVNSVKLRPSFGSTSTMTRMKIGSSTAASTSGGGVDESTVSIDIHEDESRIHSRKRAKVDLANVSFQQPWLRSQALAVDAEARASSSADAVVRVDIEEYTEGNGFDMGAEPYTSAILTKAPPQANTAPSSSSLNRYSSLGKAPAGSMRAVLQKIYRTTDNSESKMHASQLSAHANARIPPTDPLHPRNMASTTVECVVVECISLSAPFAVCLVEIRQISHKKSKDDHTVVDKEQDDATALYPVAAGDRVLAFFRTDNPLNDNRHLTDVMHKVAILDPILIPTSLDSRVLAAELSGSDNDELSKQVEECLVAVSCAMICTNLRYCT